MHTWNHDLAGGAEKREDAGSPPFEVFPMVVAPEKVRFCVLGSGSSGNAALIQTPRASVLLDIGFTPDEIGARLEGTGADWDGLSAVVLTHTHGDHLKKRTLKEILRRGIPFHCHEAHARHLRGGRYFKRLAEAGLVRTYAAERPFEVAGELLFHPLRLPHDCPPTFGFRIETADGAGRARRLGYLVDLGHWTAELLAACADVDLLALEFNHDEALERGSGRHPRLIARVLGREGHLSNVQAAGALERLLGGGPHGAPARVVQMHLSEDCNRPELAFEAACEVVRRLGAKTQVFSTRQDARGTVHEM
ncbi:MAG: MBL fold metallo-hydrolase [Planctomycetota bacterium]|nr:MBL fold metallo-hydrolase [Planctomycetota bacterium]